MWIRAVWLEGEVEEEGVLPEAWVDRKKNKVYWPLGPNALKLMKDHAIPAENWFEFKLVKCKFSSENKKECEAYNLTTTAEVSDEDRDEERRKKKRKTFQDCVTGSGLDYRSGSDDENSEKTKQSSGAYLPNPPDKSTSRISRKRDHSSPSPPPTSRKNSLKRCGSPSASPPLTPQKAAKLKSRMTTRSSPLKSPPPARSPSSSPQPTPQKTSKSSIRPTNRSSPLKSPPPVRRSPSSSPPPTPKRTSKLSSRPTTRSSPLKSPPPARRSPPKRRRSPSTSPEKRSATDIFPVSEAKFQKRVLYLLADMRASIKELGKRYEPKTSPLHIEMLTSGEEFEELEDSLQDKARKKQLIAQLGRIGGLSIRDNTRKVMKRILSNDLMSSFNMNGNGGKGAFKRTILYEVVKASVLQQQTGTETEVDAAVTACLKYAPDRAGGSGRKQKK